jgi:hemolysin activation/secretion protein
LFNIGMVGNEGHEESCWVRGSVFLDYGRVYRLDISPGSLNYCGTGFGFTANIGNHLDGRLTVGWPLIGQNLAPAGTTHIYFGIGAQF